MNLNRVVARCSGSIYSHLQSKGIPPCCVGDTVCGNECVRYQGPTNSSYLCDGSIRLAFDVNTDFKFLEWPILSCPFWILVGFDRAASI